MFVYADYYKLFTNDSAKLHNDIDRTEKWCKDNKMKSIDQKLPLTYQKRKQLQSYAERKTTRV